MTHRLTNALQQCELPNEKIWPNGRMAKKHFRMAKEGPQCIFPRFLGDTCTGGACSSVRHVTKVHIVLDSTNWQNCDPSRKLKSAHAWSTMSMTWKLIQTAIWNKGLFIYQLKGDWLDRSQSLFYFVPQESHSQASSATLNSILVLVQNGCVGWDDSGGSILEL